MNEHLKLSVICVTQHHKKRRIKLRMKKKKKNQRGKDSFPYTGMIMELQTYGKFLNVRY